ncbi:hypothetical protein K7432_010566 [Basidiobolus ranarum]|uniref:Uncharacterized protein n=1 Tax=Basidiobolus ranarum TaxID=34480 RepID=A0ABR2WNJ1_9FUNG
MSMKKEANTIQLEETKLVPAIVMRDTPNIIGAIQQLLDQPGVQSTSILKGALENNLLSTGEIGQHIELPNTGTNPTAHVLSSNEKNNLITGLSSSSLPDSLKGNNPLFEILKGEQRGNLDEPKANLNLLKRSLPLSSLGGPDGGIFHIGDSILSEPLVRMSNTERKEEQRIVEILGDAENIELSITSGIFNDKSPEKPGY